MLAQLLMNSGLNLGNDLMPAHPSNPDGHFEDLKVVRLHDQILRESGTDWKFSDDAVIKVTDTHRILLARSAQRLNCQSPTWGVKDPRVCLFLNEWQECLENPVAIFIYRDFVSCAQSLRIRQVLDLAYSTTPNTVSLDFWEDHEMPLRMWLAYNKKIISYIRSHRNFSILVSQEELVSGYPLVELANRKLGLCLNADRPTGIRTSSGKARQEMLPAVESDLENELSDVLRELDSLSVHERVIRTAYKAPSKVAVSELTNATRTLNLQIEKLFEGTDSHQASSNFEAEAVAPISKTAFETDLTDIEIVDKYLAAKQFSEAIHFILEAIESESYDKRLLLKAGIAHFWLGEYQLARDFLLSAIEFIPKNPNVYIFLGLVSLNIDTVGESNIWLKKALEIAPNALKPIELLVNNYLSVDEKKVALGYGELALKKHSDKVSAYRLLARVLAMCSEYDRALSVVESGLERFSDDEVLLNFKVICLRKAGRREESELQFYRNTLTYLRASTDYAPQLLARIESLECKEARVQVTDSVTRLLRRISVNSVPKKNKNVH